MRDVSAARDETGLALHFFLARLEHFSGEINGAITGRLGANDGAAPGEAFACHHPGELVPEPLVHSEQKSDLARADADVPRRHIRVRADMPEQLAHERLAEAHHFAVAFAFRIEVGPAFAAAHGQSGQRVLKDLLEREELQDPEVDRRMKTQAAFVGPDRAVHLNAEPAVHMQLALVVLPGDAEHDDALRLDDPLDDLRLPIFRMLIEHEGEGLDHFLDRLVELGLRRVLGLNVGHQR